MSSVTSLMERAHSESTFADRVPFDAAIAARTYLRLVDDSYSIVFLLLNSDKSVVGLLSASLIPCYFNRSVDASMSILYVAPEHRSNDAVKALITTLEQWARQRGATAVSLTVSQLERASSISALFGSLGYEVASIEHRRVL